MHYPITISSTDMATVTTQLGENSQSTAVCERLADLPALCHVPDDRGALMRRYQPRAVGAQCDCERLLWERQSLADRFASRDIPYAGLRSDRRRRDPPAVG